MEGNRGMLLEDHNDSLLVKKKEREKERKEKKNRKKNFAMSALFETGRVSVTVWHTVLLEEFYFTL